MDINVTYFADFIEDVLTRLVKMFAHVKTWLEGIKADKEAADAAEEPAE